MTIFLHIIFVYLLRYYVQPAEKYAGWVRKNFTKSWCITEKDYAVFILVFVPLVFFIFLVLLSSFARKIQRKYAQDILSIASISASASVVSES